MKYLFFLIIFFPLFFSCHSKEADAGKMEEEPPREIRSDVVTLTDLQIETAAIEFGTLEAKNLKSSIKANGMLSVPNQNKAFITSVNSGVVQTLTIQPGSFVNKGQVVATITNPEIAELQRQLQVVHAQIMLNEVELQRQQELVAGNAAPLKNVQRIQTELVTQRATKNAYAKQLSTMGLSVASVISGEIVTILAVRAPISGTISNVNAQIGSNIDATSPIAEIVNNSLLHLDLFVFEKDLTKLKDDQTIHFTLTNNTGKEYDAQIYSIGTAFANESKTIPIHAVVKGDKSGLIEGMNITALVSIGEATIPAVPTDAIVSYQGQDYIFVRTSSKDSGQTSFRRAPVVKGVSDIGFTEITLLSELKLGTVIITKGAFFAMAKMTNFEEED